MKLDRILLENFGVYARQKFQFDSAQLVLVYGPNESGKTTALNGLRQAMFGFPSKTPYLTGKPMSAEVHGTLSDKSTFQFTRKKARKDEVVGKQGLRRFEADDLPALLGNMDLESYQQLFGFSLDELREGEAALKSAKLSEALAGGGMGGANLLQQLRNELVASVTALYRTRGTSQIGSLLNEIRSSQEELRLLQVMPQAVDELRGRLRQAVQRGEDAKAQYALLHQNLSRVERLKQAYPKRQELVRIDQVLATIEVPEDVDATFIAQWSDYAGQQIKLAHSIQQEQERLEQEKGAITGLAGADTKPEFDVNIEALGHQAGEIPKLRSQLAELNRQCQEAEASCERGLAKLGFSEPCDALLGLSVSATKRSELEGWAAKHERSSHELLSVVAKLESTKEQLSRIESPDSVCEIPDNLSTLNELVAKISDEEQALEQLIESVCQKCESPEFEITGARLRARLPDCPMLDYSWPVPGNQDVSRYLRLFEEHRRNLTQLECEIQRLEADHTTSHRELLELENGSEQTAWGELKQVGAQRDQVVNHWLDELSEPLLAASISSDQQQLRLQQLQLLFQRSDGLLQQIVDTAETIARISQAQKHLRSISDSLTTAREQLLKESARREELDRQWCQAWENCPFKPLSPELMTSWVIEFESWSRVAAELDIERRRLVTRRAAVKQLRGELVDQWPTVIDFEAAWQGLQEQLEEWTQLAKLSHSETARRTAVQAMLNELDNRQNVLTAERDEVKSAYMRWLNENNLLASWPIAQVTVLVDGVDRLKRDLQTVNRTQTQIDEVSSRILTFETAVHKFSAESESTSGLPPEVLAQRWLNSLQSARKDATERAKLSASIEHRTARLAEMTNRLTDIEDRMSMLSSSVAGATSELDRTTFDSLMQRAQQATQLRTERSETLSAIEMLAGSEGLDAFLSALADSDESALSLQVIETKRSLTQCESLRQLADQEVGGLSSQLEQLAKSEAAQRSQQHLHAQRGQLAELSEQWVVGRLSQALLSRCIDRFTQDHEPVLLQLTHQFLAKLTGGRYTTVEHATGSDGSFCVRNSRGEALEPSKLSTGTREQLYLAIRMAFITHYSERHEPLPVLMDDCFVNFDDARTRLALQTLLGWKTSAQTILLSCHGRVVQQLAELAPETPVICLERQSTFPAREFAGELGIMQGAAM